MKALEVLNVIATVWEGWPDESIDALPADECNQGMMDELHRACVTNDSAHIISVAKQLVGLEAAN